jgi:hypothetical protein
MHKNAVEPVHVPDQVAVLSVTALAFSHSVFLPSTPVFEFKYTTEPDRKTEKNSIIVKYHKAFCVL